MKASEGTIRELLSGPRQYLVPLYQRIYSWGTKQLAQLWSDILELNEDDQQGAATTHFMGSLVLAPAPAMSPAGVQEWLVVDGQQRLITISLILCALRDEWASVHPEQGERINDLYLVNRWMTGDARHKLLPTQADRSAYKACVDGLAEAGKGDGVGAAYSWLRSAIRSSKAADEQTKFESIERAISTGLALVVITAHADDNVHRIFESLNNTGVRLTQGDLLRNYFFMRLPESGPRVYDLVWWPMQDLLAPDELELLLWLDLVVRGDSRAKRTDIYKAQHDRLDKLATELELVEAMKDLARRSVHLKTALQPEREADERVRLRLTRLTAWGTQTIYPLLMVLFDLRERNNIDSSDMAASLLYVESFLVRRMISGRSTNNLNRIFTSLISEMPSDRPIPDAIRHYLSGPRRYWTDDDNIRIAVRTKNFYWSGRPTQRALVLQWLEQSYGRHEKIQLADLTIEHVMPQTTTPWWDAVLREDMTDESDTAELHGLLVHTLGNLTLTGYNSELSNHSFDEKRKELGRSGVAMNQEISVLDRWGRAEILARADSLTRRIVSIWPGPEPGVVDDELPTWQMLDDAIATLQPGTWTSYSDIAELIGSHPVPVGVRIASCPAEGGHRVLTAQGTVSTQFRWYDKARTDDPTDVLKAEGLTFDGQGRADPRKRLIAVDLADKLGLDREAYEVSEDASGPEDARALRFAVQLLEQQGSDVAEAVQTFLTEWKSLGGGVEFGRSSETSAILNFMPYRHRGYVLWVSVIYPSGSMEISFQHLKTKEPFTDPTLRDMFRVRINEGPHIDIPESKIGLRPSIPSATLLDADDRAALVRAFKWLVDTARNGVDA